MMPSEFTKLDAVDLVSSSLLEPQRWSEGVIENLISDDPAENVGMARMGRLLDGLCVGPIDSIASLEEGKEILKSLRDVAVAAADAYLMSDVAE